jgi:hypothetical protein
MTQDPGYAPRTNATNAARFAVVMLLALGSLDNLHSQTPAVDYAEPRLLVGNIFPIDSEPKKLLFKSERRGMNSGNRVYATCDYTYPDGSLAARDRVAYQGGQLLSFEEELLQTGEKGSAVLRADLKEPRRRRIYFEYTVGQGAQARKSFGSELLEEDTLVDDMIQGFIQSHWNSLASGMPARFRYIVLSRKETVGFKLVKENETTFRGKAALRIRMEPTSIIIARLVDPLFFTVETDVPHRILEYTGRTTPLIKNGNKWKELDAVCVFDWSKGMAETAAIPAAPSPR